MNLITNINDLVVKTIDGQCVQYDIIKYESSWVLQTMNRIKHIVIENYS
jgi:hypothetical protein